MGETSTITFETIYNLVRNEKTNEDIQKLNPEIYDQIIQYLKTKTEIFKKSDINPKEKEKLKAQIISTRKLIKEFYERRERKILQLAINKSRSNSFDFDDSLLLEGEKDLLDDITQNLDHYRKEILLNLVNARHPFGRKPKIKEKEKIKAESSEILTIKFLSPVPKFLGMNMEVYGPFDKDEIAEIPKELADVLIERERAIQSQPA